MIFQIFTFAINILGEMLSHTTYKSEVDGNYDFNWSFKKDFAWLLTQVQGKQVTFYVWGRTIGHVKIFGSVTLAENKIMVRTWGWS